MQRWFECKCPAYWKFNKELVPKGPPNEFMERGLLVHAMLEGTIPRNEVKDGLALSIYNKLLAARRGLGLTIEKDKNGKPLVEVRQKFKFPGVPGVMWVRKIDAICRDVHGNLVVLDYKAAGAVWKTIEVGKEKIAPQAHTTQGPGYALASPKTKEWAKRIVFLVSGYRGPAAVPFTYTPTKVDFANLTAQVKLVARAVRDGNFPKIRGYACHACDFQAVCWNAPGWKKKYEERTHDY